MHCSPIPSFQHYHSQATVLQSNVASHDFFLHKAIGSQLMKPPLQETKMSSATHIHIQNVCIIDANDHENVSIMLSGFEYLHLQVSHIDINVKLCSKRNSFASVCYLRRWMCYTSETVLFSISIVQKSIKWTYNLTRFSLASGAFPEVADRSRWNKRSRPATFIRILSASMWAPLWADNTQKTNHHSHQLNDDHRIISVQLPTCICQTCMENCYV